MVDIKTFRDFVIKQIPYEFGANLVMGITKIYQDTYDLVFSKYPREQAMDLLPHNRRAEIESFLRLLPNRFPYAKVDCELNGAFNSFHVRADIGQIILTQSFSMYPEEKIREATFRNSLSGFNIQERFVFPDDKIIKTDDKYYAILKHGAQGREAQRPEFFRLDFPSSNYENIVAPIDVLKLYNISPNFLLTSTETIESIEALTNPILKTPAKIANEGK